MSRLICEIVTPTTRLFYEYVYMVVVPGVEGEMGFLEDHVPLLSILADGTVRIEKEKDGETQKYIVQGGGIEVTGKKVIVLADRAMSVEDIDVEAARKELEKLEQQDAALAEDDPKKVNLGYDIGWCKLQVAAGTK